MTPNSAPARPAGGPPAGGGGPRGTSLQGTIPLIKPPYDRITAYDMDTGEDVAGEVAMPAKQTGSPMTYLLVGKQYIVVAVSQSGAYAGAELIAYALP
jgi:glucose dehydrogenase